MIVGDRSSKFGDQITSDDEYADDSEDEENADLSLSDHDDDSK